MRYLDVLGGRTNLDGVPFHANAPEGGSFGQTFMQDCATAGLNPAAHTLLVCQRLYEALRTRGWIWDPGAPGDSYTAGAQLLDGTVNRGECAFVPYALAYLMNAPAPWGWGVGGATVEIYSGPRPLRAPGQGFISVHANPYLPGPLPNIKRPNGRTLPGYYMWANHKVMLYAGRRYDVCYRTDYANLADMAAATLALVRAGVRLNDLRAYDPTRLPGGLLSRAGMAMSNVYWWNTHTISVYEATGPDANVTGYYLSWQQTWVTMRGRRSSDDWYGPYAANPLA